MGKGIGTVLEMPKKIQREYNDIVRQFNDEETRHDEVSNSIRKKYETLKKKKGFLEPSTSAINAIRRVLGQAKVTKRDKSSPESIRQQINALRSEESRLQQLCLKKHGHSWCHGDVCVICDFSIQY